MKDILALTLAYLYAYTTNLRKKKRDRNVGGNMVFFNLRVICVEKIQQRCSNIKMALRNVSNVESTQMQICQKSTIPLRPFGLLGIQEIPPISLR